MLQTHLRLPHVGISAPQQHLAASHKVGHGRKRHFVEHHTA